jgi:hypothetical protein
MKAFIENKYTSTICCLLTSPNSYGPHPDTRNSNDITVLYKTTNTNIVRTDISSETS